MGDNTTLISVNRLTGKISAFKLPDVTVPARGSGLPALPPLPWAQQLTGIDALAVTRSGSIVVARQLATELQVFDPVTGQTSAIALPSGTALAGLGADIADQASGDIASALYAGHGVHELGQYSAAQRTVSEKPCPACAVAMTGSALAVTGPGCLATGTVPGTTGPASLTLQPASAGSEHQPCAVPLTTGNLAMCAPGGAAIAAPGSSADTECPLGDIATALSAGPARSSGSASSHVVAVPVTAGLMSAGPNGGLWFTPAQGGAVVGLVSRS